MLDSYLTMILVFATWSMQFCSASSVILNALNDSTKLFQSISPCLKSYLSILKQNLINSHLSLKTKFKHLLTFKAYLRRINYSLSWTHRNQYTSLNHRVAVMLSLSHLFLFMSTQNFEQPVAEIVEHSVPTIPYCTSNRVDRLNK